MEGTGVVDRFLAVFASYIDSGFGLLGGEVAFIATTLIVIDVTLAALFWTWGADNDIIARLVKKTLFVGAFAYIIGNWNALARIVFESFAGLGLLASGGAITTDDLLRPGRVAQVGIDAAAPLIESISDLLGFISFFENFIQIVVLLIAWLIVILAFFVLSVQLFITLIEFKLVTLCGFVLVPFGLFNPTSFMAEKVLGHVLSSGIKVLVLAAIVGIGSTLFDEFTSAIGADQPTIEEALAIVLGALCMLGLGIFGPAVANGLISGGPQLGAGAAAGTVLAAGAVGAAGLAGARMGLGAASGAARGGAYAGGAAQGAYRLGTAGKSGAAAFAGGVGGVVAAAGGAALSPLRKMASALQQSATQGSRASVSMTGGAIVGATPQAASSGAAQPAWAQRMKRQQALIHGATIAAHTLSGGDSRGPGVSVDAKQKD
ncbi:MAG: P-type conjugative transfer protein TrbL [Hyphomonadaceae bacterium]